ncbi:S-adenosyl-L-methionine-dependent methyltransferase [Bimuria novae-zelandiae CBS 107.79]|uniref:S-adenosyl-L-methionine-dependent methyltransferase n=1 Tax=Bimuria novae-zelandiae CBS 107.79 TaxID=1447943 RepID=A0A6A5UWZ6_9PLEO|nr:S-adenosyl-L-methionine-dependent methyltransferase [Bimuria novae-zelandiae CBS 107.79]
MSRLTPIQLLDELEAISRSPPTNFLENVELRAKLYIAAKKASAALERPTVVVVRLLLSQPVEDNFAPKTLDQLLATTGVDRDLLKRILRALTAFGAIKEVDQEKFPLRLQYQMLGNASFGHAVVNCIIREKPTAGLGFGTLMSTWGEVHALLQHLYPVAEKMIDEFDRSISTVMFVDVGGGHGSKAVALKTAFSHLPGRIIVPDLAMSIDQAPKAEGREFQVHDFFTDQPVKNAKIYYTRQCLHNWPDDLSIKILQHLAQAMKPEYSRILAHDQMSRNLEPGSRCRSKISTRWPCVA